jgi:broad specificity phosphatase PhoE
MRAERSFRPSHARVARDLSLQILLVSAVVAGALAVPPAVASLAAQEAVFLVRHAERQDDSLDSALSAEGRTRAAKLAALLRDARITAIFVTEYQRTAETAKPIADLLGVPVQRIPAADTEALVAKLRAPGAHDRVLVVSHSDKLPILLKQLGYPQEVTIAREEYDNLFIVVPVEKSAPVVARLRF